jgi:hypothetical protein
MSYSAKKLDNSWQFAGKTLYAVRTFKIQVEHSARIRFMHDSDDDDVRSLQFYRPQLFCVQRPRSVHAPSGKRADGVTSLQGKN